MVAITTRVVRQLDLHCHCCTDASRSEGCRTTPDLAGPTACYQHSRSVLPEPWLELSVTVNGLASDDIARTTEASS